MGLPELVIAGFFLFFIVLGFVAIYKFWVAVVRAGTRQGLRDAERDKRP